MGHAFLVQGKAERESAGSEPPDVKCLSPLSLSPWTHANIYRHGQGSGASERWSMGGSQDRRRDDFCVVGDFLPPRRYSESMPLLSRDADFNLI
jgi:hypothetical protein